MFLIGSRAARYHGLKIPRSVDQSDWDVIGNLNDLEIWKSFPDVKIKESSKCPGKFHIQDGDQKIEFDATNNASNSMLKDEECEIVQFEINGRKITFSVPSKEILFQIKRSHVPFNIHFDKSIMDLRAMMKQWNMKGYDYNTEFYNARYNEAKERFGARQERIKLNKSNDEFFKGGMNLRTYVHDDLHRAVAFYDEPLFEKCKKDRNSAMVSKELFFQLSHEDRVKMAIEESSVIALERFVIPLFSPDFRLTESDKLSLYRKGMLKEIRDLSRGYFQSFMIDNILDIEKPKQDYVEKFKTALRAGKIRRNPVG